MYAGRPFTKQTKPEQETFTFDFQLELGTDEQILDAEWTVWVVNGTDAAPEDRINGAFVINGTKVSQNLLPGENGVNYGIQCKAITNRDQALILWSTCAVAYPPGLPVV